MSGSVIDDDDRRRWHRDGWCVLGGLFTDDEVAAGRSAAARLFPPASEPAGSASVDGNGDQAGWDPNKPTFPFVDAALNRLAVHERLIDLAVDLLGVDRVRLYQGMTIPKYPMGTDDEQLLHADYGNHTLLVPRADPGFQQLTLFVYLSDVDESTAATRMVSRRLTEHIPVERTYLAIDDYADLYDAEVPAVGPAGSVLAYRPDTYHRGTVLAQPDTVRMILHVAFKPADTDWLGYQAWPAEAERLSWHRFVATASLRQLLTVGFPEPGHPYWNDDTLRGVAARYPSLDMEPWRRALAPAVEMRSAAR